MLSEKTKKPIKAVKKDSKTTKEPITTQ